MLPRNEHSRRSRRGRASLAIGSALVGLALVTVVGSPAVALDGRVDVRTLHQEGRSGDQAYSSDNLWEIFGLEQAIRLSPNASFRLQYLARRELLKGTAAGTSVDNTTVTLTPSATLSWQSTPLRASLFARGNRVDQDNTGLPTLRDDNLEFGLWTSGRFGHLSGDANYQDDSSWRRGNAEDRENRERNGTGRLRLDLTRHEDVEFTYSRVDLNSITLSQRTVYDTQQLQIRGDRDLVRDKAVHATWSINHRRFNQRNTFSADAGQQYLPPLAGGFWLDDTPGFLDPLENQPQPVPALFDNDRSTPTVINLGDNATPGRDYGGDFRNIYLDFGEPVAMVSAFLYVDRKVTFLPEMLQWDLYFCDEAEGRDWGSPVPAGSWSARYVESETGRQGWEITFVGGATHRRLKLVDRKIGPTIGDLFVTEFEILENATTAQPELRSRQERTTATGGVEVRLSSRLRVHGDIALDRRDRAGDGRQERTNGGVLASWLLGGWSLTGQYQESAEHSPKRLRTDSNSRQVSLQRRNTDRFGAHMAWVRTNDNTYSVRQVTESVMADGTWRAAPALTFNQKVTRGWRTSAALDGNSDSWVVSSEVRSSPRPSMRLDFVRTTRWVGQEAGAGFTSFAETEIDASWEITPLLSWSGQAVGQRREREDWIYRNSLSWIPLRGGSVLLSFSANDYQDSRADDLRRGGSVGVDWQARPRLTLSGSAEKSYERLLGRESWPFGFQLRGYWTF